MKESQCGKTLLRGPKCDNQELTKTLNYNQSQREHIEAHYDHLRNTFLREIKARPNPTIILERPPSGPARSALDRETRRELPGYMRATFTKPGRQFSNIRTMDAYSVETSRVSKPWDVKNSGISNTHYRCIAKPSTPLSRADKRDLATSFHRLVAAYAKSPEQQSAKTEGPRKATHPKRRLAFKTRGQASARVKDKHKTPRLFTTDARGHKSRKVPRSVRFEALPKLGVAQQRMYVIHSEQNASAQEKKTDTEQIYGKRDKHSNESTAVCQSTTPTKPTRPTSTRVKHRKVKRKQHSLELHRSGLIILT